MARPPRLPQQGPSIFDLDEPPVEPGSPEELASHEPASRSVETGDTPRRRLVIEADGGSRGNPGPAAYGAVVRDPQTGAVLNSEGRALGVATNNVAEYSGLIAGLEMARALDPAAAVDVRMDSKLVIEQMAGRWKVKHPGMRPLALKAQSLRPPEVTWTWVPRAENKAADALVNAALDGNPRTRR